MPSEAGAHEGRTYAVTGAASGIGAATAAWLRARGGRVIACDLKDGDVAADLATEDGRAALVTGVARLADGRLDGVVANAGGGPAETMIALNFFGTVATLEGLRPLLAKSEAPRAVAISSVSCLAPGEAEVIEACLGLDEAAADAAVAGVLARGQSGLELYGSAKRALNRWARRAAVSQPWAGAGVILNVVAPGVIDTPAAAWILSSEEGRAEMARRTPLPTARPAPASALAALAAWCVGRDNGLMTGQILFADGGMECRMRGDLAW
ncbi:SDR family oxidoreductase [Phenylobacterium sp.]|uniref:SDR family oxidoreductase n=1 Tax=Phenylobacterium sp. TaxID=1871053 RepID=UPI002CE2E934|nr:SDR family oxidoreductase [Phenylobacterium sp.]HLZ74853.1 SDR family oxidoreductase [Phenylobacterium sp.]